ncbi:hypothetical protein NC77_26415 [Janthinobacterium lividum]|nr:hypothetical protein NC77_26415 [Janthinobacterium lividum]
MLVAAIGLLPSFAGYAPNQTYVLQNLVLRPGRQRGRMLVVLESLNQYVTCAAWRKAVKATEYCITQLLVERGCLEFERLKVSARAATAYGFAFGCLQQFTSVALAA